VVLSSFISNVENFDLFEDEETTEHRLELLDNLEGISTAEAYNQMMTEKLKNQELETNLPESRGNIKDKELKEEQKEASARDVEQQIFPIQPEPKQKKKAWATVVYRPSDELMQRSLILFQSLKEVKTEGEFLLVTSEMDESILKRYQHALKSLNITRIDVNFAVLTPQEIRNPSYYAILEKSQLMREFVRLRVFELEEYDILVVLDSDMLFLKNSDELLQMPHGSFSGGPWSPLNAGLWIIHPSSQEFQDLLEIIREGNFSYTTGWRNTGLISGIKNFGSETIQGLLYYYFERLLEVGVRLDRDIYNYQGTGENAQRVKLIHFTGCGKPPNRSPQAGCVRFHDAWNKIHSTVSRLWSEQGRQRTYFVI